MRQEELCKILGLRLDQQYHRITESFWLKKTSKTSKIKSNLHLVTSLEHWVPHPVSMFLGHFQGWGFQQEGDSPFQSLTAPSMKKFLPVSNLSWCSIKEPQKYPGKATCARLGRAMASENNSIFSRGKVLVSLLANYYGRTTWKFCCSKLRWRFGSVSTKHCRATQMPETVVKDLGISRAGCHMETGAHSQREFSHISTASCLG